MPAEEVKSESAKKNEDWMNSKWRPAMGWMYMAGMYGRLCVVSSVVEPGPSHRWWRSSYSVEPNHPSRCWSVPHGHGCHTWYRRIWSHTRKNGWCQQWWYSTTYSNTCVWSTCCIHTNLWCAGHISASIWSTCAQTHTHTSTSFWCAVATTTPRNLKETHHVRNHILDRSRSICRLELATT
jgi:hypothetical protein